MTMIRTARTPLARITVGLAALALVSALTTPAWAANYAGVIAKLEGEVKAYPGGKKKAKKAKPGMTLMEGDIIETAPAAKVRIVLDDESVLSLGPETKAEIKKFVRTADTRDFAIGILFGKFRAAVGKVFGAKTNQGFFETATAVAGIRGTVLWGDTKLDAICALEGEITVKSKKAGDEKKLTAGNCGAKFAEGAPADLKPSAEDVAKYLEEVTLK